MIRHTRRGFLKTVGAATASAAALPTLAAEDTAAETYAKFIASDRSLVSYLRLSGDVADVKANLSAEIRKGEIGSIDGPLGQKAVSFDKGCFLSDAKADALDLPDTSVALFFRIASPPAGGYNPCLIAKRANSPQTRFSIHIMHDLTELALWNGHNVVQIAAPLSPLKVGQWYHLAMAMKRDGLAVWLDGVPCVPQANGIGLTVDAKGLPFQLAASSPNGDEHFDCAMAEVAIFSGALNAEDVGRQIEAAGWLAQRDRMLEEQKKREAERRRLAEEDLRKRQEQLAGWLNDPRILERGQTRVYRGEHLGAISFALGGIGAGCIQMNGRAQRHIWQIFNNFSQANVPDTFFAIRAKPAGGEAVVRALHTAPAGPFAAMKELSFRGEYPFAWYDFDDPALPVRVTLEAFTPMIPLNAKDSAIPCAIFNITVTNPGQNDVQVNLLATQQNAVGFDGKGAILGRRYGGYGRNRNSIVTDAGATELIMDKGGAVPEGNVGIIGLGGQTPSTEAMVLATPVKAIGCASWASLKALHNQFLASGSAGDVASAEPSPNGETLDGAIAVPLMLKPGEKRTIPFILTWHFPNAHNGGEIKGWQHDGNMYANWFKDASDVAAYVTKNLDRLTRETRLFHDTFYQSNLPYYLLDRITSQLAILHTKTCFWAKDGYFGAWEGCGPGGGCCAGSCTHVWHYAQAHARLFPELARIMRETTYSYQRPDGGLPHRHPSLHPALDGHCGDILGAYREFLCGGGPEWLKKMWPKVKKAMDYAIRTHDADEDGVLSGAQWNTLDGNLSGSTSWIGTLYLSALHACEKMADLQGEADVAKRYKRIRESGAKKQDATLFNGEYYIQIRDPQVQSDYGNGCEIDQLLGEWWAHQVDLPPNYPAEHCRSAMSSLLKYNFRGNFHGVKQVPRKFVDDNDAGLQMIQWPKGDRPNPTILYGDEVMTGFEYAAAATMIQLGMLREGLMLALAISDRYDGRLRSGLTNQATASWGYSGNPFGDDECGKFYARAMSVWSMLLACQGFVYDGAAGVIGFKPVWKPEDHVSFFTTAEGYGLFTQKREGGQQTVSLKVSSGKLDVHTIVLATAEKPSKVVVSAAAWGIGADFRFRDGELVITLRKTWELAANQAIDVEIS